MSHQQSLPFGKGEHQHRAEMREKKVLAKSASLRPLQFAEARSEHERELQEKVRSEIATLLEVDLDDADFAELLLARDEIDSVLDKVGFEAEYDHKAGRVHVKVATGEKVDRTGDYDQEYHK